MRTTYHLVPAAVWGAGDHDAPFAAPSLITDGFIHCTDGADELVATANRHYRDDPREFLALIVDLDAVRSSWRIEDRAGIYPHIFGPIAPGAIVEVRAMFRARDGTFTGVDPGSTAQHGA